MPRDYKNIKNNKSEPKIKNTGNLFSFLIGLVLGTFATSIYFNQNENIYEGKPSFNDNNYNKENENIETINTKEITFDFPTILEERTVEKIIEKTYPETQINIDKSEKITRYIIQVGSFKNFKSADALKAKLAFSGLSADIQKTNIIGKGISFRVFVGPFEDKEKKDAVKKILAANSVDSVTIERKIEQKIENKSM
jgi:cell division protein FtsN